MTRKNTDFDFALKQIAQIINVTRQSLPFFRNNRLLQGLFEQKWIVIVLLIGSLLYSYSFIVGVYEFFYTPSPEEVMEVSFASTSDLGKISDVIKDQSKQAAFDGGSKYLLLVLLEVIIFFVSVKTLSILNKTPYKPTFREFLKAERRMIKVMLINFIYSLIAQIVVHVALSILGLSKLSVVVMFFVHAYFIGYAFLDNYTEQLGLELKESRKIIFQHKFASTTLGVIISGLLLIPVIGAIVTPFLGGVIATLYGHNQNMENTVI